MPVVRRTYADIYRDGKKRLKTYTPVNNFNPQGITRGYLDIISIEGDKLYDTIDYVYRAADPTRAVGSDLDRVGRFTGEVRTESTLATDFTYTNFHFMIDSRLSWSVQKLIEQNYTVEERQILTDRGFIVVTNGIAESLTIPQGMVVGNTGGTISYTTSAPAVLISNQSAYVPIVSTATGSASNVQSNVLISHNINSIPELKKIAHFIRCTNTFPIQNGSQTLTDEEYRYNICIAPAAFISNEISIRKAALSIPGVRDILYERHKFGNGTVHLVLDGVSPLISHGLIQAVTEKVSQVASNDKIYVSAPEYLGVELTFYIELDAGITNEGSLRDAAKNAIIQYINDLPIGGEIVWNQIITNVLAIDGIKDFIPNIFKYGTYNPYTKINSKQILLRFLNQKAKYNQRWYCDSGLIKCCS